MVGGLAAAAYPVWPQKDFFFVRSSEKMSLHALTRGFAQLAISKRPQALASHKNGLCASQRISAARPQQIESVSTSIVCGKQKIKTRKAVAKRFTVTAKGKLLRRKPGKQHINEKLSRAHLRKLGKKGVVEKRDVPNIAPNLPYSGVRQSRN